MPIPPAKPRDDDVLMTVREVAERDRCSEKTVRRAIAEGRLAALRVGPGRRLLRISRAAHAAYRASGEE